MTDERKVDVSADDDLFDDQIADAIWEAASNGEGRITAVSLRRELTLLGLQIISKAYHDSVSSARDEAVRERDEARVAMNAALQRVSYLSTSKLGFVEALDACQRGLELWRDKPYNAKWWRRIDGTPIPNDMLVCIAEIFGQTANADRATIAALRSAVENIRHRTADRGGWTFDDCSRQLTWIDDECRSALNAVTPSKGE